MKIIINGQEINKIFVKDEGNNFIEINKHTMIDLTKKGNLIIDPYNDKIIIDGEDFLDTVSAIADGTSMASAFEKAFDHYNNEHGSGNWEYSDPPLSELTRINTWALEIQQDMDDIEYREAFYYDGEIYELFGIDDPRF
jgi:hypothetical protein